MLSIVDEIKAILDLSNLEGPLRAASNMLEYVEERLALPPEDEPWLQENAAILRPYLIEQGMTDVDPLVIETACFIPGLWRGVNPPLLVLTAKRGGFSPSRLDHAHQWVIQAQNWIADFRAMSRPRLKRLMAFRGITDPIPTADITASLRFMAALVKGFDANANEVPLLNARFPQLSQVDVADLVRYLSRLSQKRNEWPLYTALNYLGAMHRERLRGLHGILLEHGLLEPECLFQTADAEISRRLADRLRSGRSRRSRFLELVVLAWIRDANAIDYFLQHPDEQDHIIEAGWELTAEGHVRQLYYDTCYRVASQGQPGTTRFMTHQSETCPLCGEPLVALMDLDLTDPRLAYMQLAGTRLKVISCLSCAGWIGNVYADVDLEGKAHWNTALNASEKPQRSEPIVFVNEKPYVLAAEPSPIIDIEDFHSIGQTSKLGGFPAWITGTFHPNCPQCSQGMIYLGQVHWWNATNIDTTHFCFLCPDCHITGCFSDST